METRRNRKLLFHYVGKARDLNEAIADAVAIRDALADPANDERPMSEVVAEVAPGHPAGCPRGPEQEKPYGWNGWWNR